VTLSRLVVRAATLFGVACGIAGCAGGPSPIAMTCTITAGKDANPASTGRPSPIPLRVYALKSEAAFNGADFLALYQRDTATLAADVTGKDEFTLAPGESAPCSKTLTPDTHFIGVVGAYRDIEHAHWRAVAPVDGKKATVKIQADALAVTVTVSK
jgi:type VI secretion system protein VasD